MNKEENKHSNSNEGMRVPEQGVDQPAPKQEAPVECDASAEVVIGNRQYNLANIPAEHLKTLSCAFYELAGASKIEDTDLVSVPLGYHEFFEAVPPAHYAEMGQALQDRQMKLCPGVFDRVFGFLDRNKTAIIITAGVAAGAVGTYYAYNHHQTSDNEDELDTDITGVYDVYEAEADDASDDQALRIGA